jgi:hypothetical protein
MKRIVVLLCLSVAAVFAAETKRNPLDPRGKVHIPIGVANTVDTLKTFVEAEGNFSPGFGSYGVYFWVWDHQTNRLFAPTMDDVPCEHGFAPGGLLIPWSRWKAAETEVTTEVCEVKYPSPAGNLFAVGSRATLKNRASEERKLSFYIAVRPLGAAGFAINEIGTTKRQIDVDGIVAVWASEDATSQLALPSDTVSAAVMAGMPASGPTFAASASSTNKDASGALRFDITLPANGSKVLTFVCPVLPGRNAVGHAWDGASAWAQLDVATLNPTNAPEKLLQPDPGEAWWASLDANKLFAMAEVYWRGISQRSTLKLPDTRWSESFAAIVAHTTLCMNQGAPDVAVVNYNVFNRDAVYLANVYQKSGNSDLSELAIEHFLNHPFNGRVQPEADNPGQILWIMGEHFKFTRDLDWLRRNYHRANKLASMIAYYRTQPEPHWVSDVSLEFGDKLPANARKQLKPGICDGFHPEYTEAFDIAGIRSLMGLSDTIGNDNDSDSKKLSQPLFGIYTNKFETNLANGYGSYGVLWPTRLYPLENSPANDQFKGIGAQQPTGWRYFPLAKAHQGLLAGNRAAAAETLNAYLSHPQMRGWYALDEGGDSGPGGWNRVRTTWRQGKTSDAMPHGWSSAEFFLLLRDALMFEDGEKLILFAGIPADWFTNPAGILIRDLPTHFGRCTVEYSFNGKGASLMLTGVKPSGGVVLRLPPGEKTKVTVAGAAIERNTNGDFVLPGSFGKVEIGF